MRLRLPVAAVLLAVWVVSGPAWAQTAPVLVERLDDGHLAADVGEPAVAGFRLFNLNPEDDFYVSVQVAGPASWETGVGRDRFFLAPRNATEVEVTFAPARAAEAEADFEVTFSLVHGATGEVTKVVEVVRVASLAPPLVLDAFANPLPPPLDNAYGTFLLDLAFWVVVAVLAIFVGDAVVRAVTARASSDVTRGILTKLRRPVFLFVFFLGLARSFAILPRNPLTVLLAKTLVAVGVGIFGLYVLYRVLDAALFYYQTQVASRTETRVDDVLIPLARKVGIVVLYAVGVIMVLRSLGWDPTIVFAGAGIAGLVIAFAAQDTFSNLFSGVFLMLDQPFREGDEIQLETGEIVRVESIGLRTTRLYHGRNHETIIVPNNQLATKRVINLSGPDQHYWMMVDVGASYASDPEHVRKVLLDVAGAHPRILKADPWAPLVILKGFGESSVDFILRFAVEDYRDRFGAASEVRFLIKAAFDREGIEIPFPQRTLWVKETPPLRLDDGRSGSGGAQAGAGGR